MKKILFLSLFFLSLSTLSFSQSAGKGSNEKSGKRGFISRMFHESQRKKAHQTMKHFDPQKKDPNIANNGTSIRRNRKRSYKVDGDGFSESSQVKRRSKGRGTK
jgi:hypothetical protein